MKNILITILVLITVNNVQSFGQTKLYAVRLNSNLTADSFFVHDVAIFGAGVYNSSGVYVMPTVDSMAAINGFEMPQAIGKFFKSADGIYRNFSIRAQEVDWAGVNNKPSTFTPSAHDHTASEISNSTTAGRNFMTLSNPLEASVPAIQSNGTVNTRTSAQLKQDLSLDQVNNTTDANKPLSTAAIAALALKETIPVAGQGTGGSVTQTGNKGTAVTLNKICGTITTTNAALAAAAEVSFNLNNSTIALTDVVVVSLQGGAGVGTHQVWVSATAAGLATISIANLSTGSLSQALVINFMVIKSVNN